MSENTKIERRYVVSKVELRATDGEMSHLVGYAATYDTETVIGGSFVEVIRAGAFTNAIKNKADVILCRNHNRDLLLARTSSGTLVLSEDTVGLRFDGVLADTTVARDTLMDVNHGNLVGCSFAFLPVAGGERWSEGPNGMPRRELLDLELYDVSVVSDPAYPGTEVSTRSLESLNAYQESRNKSAMDHYRRRCRVLELEM